MFDITFLGTGSMQPTHDRNITATYIGCGREKVLVDCAEGTQRQMRIAGLKPTQLTRIFITHYHGDHVLGLGGLVRNLAANNYSGTLEIYGPSGLQQIFHHIVHSAYFTERISIVLHEVLDSDVIQCDGFSVFCTLLAHSVPCMGYRLVGDSQRKINLSYLKKFGLHQHPLLGKLQKGEDVIYEGKKISASRATTIVPGKILALVFDTGYCLQAITLAKDADLLICESTHAESEKAKAHEYKHLTSCQAAQIAKKAKVKKLVLTHFSQRYKTVTSLVKEAKEIFPHVTAAKDFMTVKV